MESHNNNSRRDFLKTSGLATAGAVAASMISLPKAHAEGTDEIKVALIGAGGRGSGAAADCVKAGGNVKIWAIADAFEDLPRCMHEMFLNVQTGIPIVRVAKALPASVQGLAR